MPARHDPAPHPRRWQGISHLLLDIEGTTCPVSFVAAGLFPYASRKLPGFLQSHAHEPQVRDLLLETAKHWLNDHDFEAKSLWQKAMQAWGSEERGAGLNPQGEAERLVQEGRDQLVGYLQLLIARDRKVTPLKEIQGLIWAEGYDNGSLQAPLYKDVPPALKRWHAKGVVLATYSSGSVEAQRLLYRHSTAGNLQNLFTHWFDTRCGNKKEERSYLHIAAEMACSASAVLFISDATSELEAASSAGMHVMFSDREGNPDRDAGRFEAIQTYDNLDLAP